jgi:hypothetical protein
MAFAQAIRSKAKSAGQTSGGSSRRPAAPLSGHPLFAPLIGMWGLALGAGCVLVLPGAIIQLVAAPILPSFAAEWARPTLATTAAAFMGLMCYAGAQLVSRRHRAPGAVQAVQPIDPARELGSDSFDSPLADLEFLNDAEWEEADEDWFPDGSNDEPLDWSPEAAERELTLEEFGALPGRNAVWVEEPQAPSSDTVIPDKPAVPAAIAKLRAVPPAELSLCEMVERFAAALQEYHTAQEHAPEEQDREQREAVLNEALKALATVTHRGLAEMRPSEGVTAPVAAPDHLRGAA